MSLGSFFFWSETCALLHFLLLLLVRNSSFLGQPSSIWEQQPSKAGEERMARTWAGSPEQLVLLLFSVPFFYLFLLWVWPSKVGEMFFVVSESRATAYIALCTSELQGQFRSFDLFFLFSSVPLSGTRSCCCTVLPNLLCKSRAPAN